MCAISRGSTQGSERLSDLLEDTQPKREQRSASPVALPAVPCSSSGSQLGCTSRRPSPTPRTTVGALSRSQGLADPARPQALSRAHSLQPARGQLSFQVSASTSGSPRAGPAQRLAWPVSLLFKHVVLGVCAWCVCAFQARCPRTTALERLAL